jgi:hypothetical protein
MGTSSGVCAAAARHPAVFFAFGSGGQSPSTNLHHTTRNTLIIVTTHKRGHLTLTVAMDGSTMNDPITHRNESLMEPSEWVHSGAPPDEH